jgi:hypothetical protein
LKFLKNNLLNESSNLFNLCFSFGLRFLSQFLK